MVSSSVKALTVRSPCSDSCMVSMMRVPPVNWLCASPRTRFTILRSTISAGGATTSPNSDITGSCITMTTPSAIKCQEIAADRGDQEVEDLRDGGRARGHALQEFGRVPVGEEADALAHQFGEHAPLVVGEDGVGDALQDDLLDIGRKALQREQAEDERRQQQRLRGSSCGRR